MAQAESDAKFWQFITLLNDQAYHSSKSLANRLAVTRTTIKRMVNRLKSYEVKITALPRLGYRLPEPLQLLDHNYIATHANIPPAQIKLLPAVASTNEYLKELPYEKAPKICIAELQTAGKGRLGRTWYSPYAQNIYLSLRYLLPQELNKTTGLSLVVALAIIKLLKKYRLPHPLAKWPNDIVVQDKKIAGILVEMQPESAERYSAIIGIGINVNMNTTGTQQISQPWTSIYKILGQQIERNRLCVSLLHILAAYLAKFATAGFNSFMPEWRSVDYLSGKKIILKTAHNHIKGIAKGIDHRGQILIANSTGSITPLSSGAITLLPPTS